MTREGRRLPRSRDEKQLLLQELPDELLVYDRSTHQAHCLNRSAAAIFKRCDGVRTYREMIAELAAAGLPASAEVIDVAVAEFARVGLLAPMPEAAMASSSRRDVLKRASFIAGAALLMPLVQSIVAPSIAEAASGCSSNGDTCCMGMVCNGAHLTCVSGTCQTCGTTGNICCSGSCDNGLFCDPASNNTCQPNG